MAEIIKQSLRYVVPFMSKDDKVLEIKSDKWIIDNGKDIERDVYQYITNSVFSDRISNNANIGSSYVYKKDDIILSLRYIPSNHGEYFKVTDFDITDMGIFLFTSKIGFIWYEIDNFRAKDEAGNDITENLLMDELIFFNSKFKELNYFSNTKLFKRVDNPNPFTMGTWIAKIIKEAVGEVDYFAERENNLHNNFEEKNYPKYVPDKALLYNYIIYENITKNDLISYAYYMTKGYKYTYKMPSDIKNKMMFPFENIIWYACSEGVGYYAYASDDNKKFLIKGMAERYMADYFLLYILALNNKYSLIRFSKRVGSELPAYEEYYFSPALRPDSNEDIIQRKSDLYELEHKVTELTTEIDVFLTKNIRASVSYVEHQSNFYNYLKKVYHIREIVDNLIIGVSALQRLLAQVVETERYYDNNKEMIKWRKKGEYKRLKKEKDRINKERYTDYLTKAGNADAYFVLSNKIFNYAKKNKKILFVCSADANGLKYVNDTFGHEEGDNVIIKCASILRRAMNKGDILFRKGGDEFAILGIRDSHTENDEKIFNIKAEKMKKQINKKPGLKYEVSISYGMIFQDMKDFSGDLKTLFDIADDRMYAMKKKVDKHCRD